MGGGLTASAVLGAAFMNPLNGDVITGAFAGASIFVVSAKDFSLLIRLFLGVVSFAVGIVTAPFATQLIDAITPDVAKVEIPVGALFSSAAAVRVLLMFSRHDDDNFFKRIYRGGNK